MRQVSIDAFLLATIYPSWPEDEENISQFSIFFFSKKGVFPIPLDKKTVLSTECWLEAISLQAQLFTLAFKPSWFRQCSNPDFEKKEVD